MATYGHVPLKFLGMLSFGAAGTDEAAVCAMTNVPHQYIISTEFSPKIFRPGYILCVDTNTRSIVLGIRGSQWPHDALTDLSCTSERMTLELDDPHVALF